MKFVFSDAALPESDSGDLDELDAEIEAAKYILVGDFVQATADDLQGDFRERDTGLVIGTEAGYLPTVQWERTGVIVTMSPSEINILCEAGFACDERSTPKKPRREFLHRGLV